MTSKSKDINDVDFVNKALTQVLNLFVMKLQKILVCYWHVQEYKYTENKIAWKNSE